MLNLFQHPATSRHLTGVSTVVVVVVIAAAAVAGFYLARAIDFR